MSSTDDRRLDIGRWDDADKQAARETAKRSQSISTSSLTDRDGRLRLVLTDEEVESETAWLASDSWVDAQVMR